MVFFIFCLFFFKELNNKKLHKDLIPLIFLNKMNILKMILIMIMNKLKRIKIIFNKNFEGKNKKNNIRKNI